MIHLCYHTAVHHGLAHPHGYRDILGVIRVEQENLDWLVLVERARAWRVSVAVWAALSVARITNYELRITNQEEDLIPEWALEALRVPRWRQWALRPFVRRAAGGRAVLVSGTMRFLGVLVVDRVRDLPGVVLRAPTSAWACSPASVGCTFAMILPHARRSGGSLPIPCKSSRAVPAHSCEP